MLPKIQHSISTIQSVDSKRYGASKELRKKASTSSVLLSLKDLPYRPFNRNSSIEVAKELKQIAQAQKDAPDWHNGQYAQKLDKEFLGIFEDYASKNNLVIDLDFINQSLRDIDPIILGLKIFYDRPRPYQINDYHNIDLKLDDSDTAQTPSYPSGHALQGRLLYRILEKDNPSHAENLKKISDQISYARILRGVHFPSDNEFAHEIVDRYLMPKINKNVYLKSKASKKQMKNNPFKYTSSFENDIVASCVDGTCQRFNISQASLETLRPLIPEEVDLTKNIDLLGVAFNAAVVNKFNKNGDGIDTDTALAIGDYFINKPTNIEHNKEKVVGHIISSAFSDINTSELLERDQLRGSLDPFNISLGALVYKVVNPSFARMLEQTDENESFHNKISASWEIGFNDYYIALGSKDLNEAELITEKSQIKEFKKYLRAYDGEGVMDDGTPVNRLVVGDIYPLGIGFTTNPAAEVEGVIVENQKPVHIKEEKNKAEIIEVQNKDFWKKPKETEKNSSLSQKNNVNMSNALIMDTQDLLKQIEGLLSDKVGESQHFEETVASVSKVMMEAIKEKDELWQKEKSEKENALSEAKERHDSLSEEVEGLKEKLIATEKHLEELAEEKRLREAKDLFNSRMAAITSAFELGEEDLKIVAADLSELATEEEAFASYQEKLGVMWQHKTKAHLDEQEKAFQSRLDEAVAAKLEELSETKASEETTSEDSEEAVEELLENVEEESAAAITNNNEEAAAEELSLREKFNKAFSSENIKIQY